MTDKVWESSNWYTGGTSSTSGYFYDLYAQNHEIVMTERDWKYRGEETFKPREESVPTQLSIKKYIESVFEIQNDKLGQYVRSILGDFEKQHKQEDVKEPQTIFHFDPKGIVDKWPEKKS